MKYLVSFLFFTPIWSVGQTTLLREVEQLRREISHVRELMDEREKQRIQHDQLTERSVDIAVANLDERLNSMNEFRAQQKDMINTLVTRVEFDMVVKRIAELEKFQTKTMTILAIAIFLMPVIFWLLNKYGNKNETNKTTTP